jgi:cell division protein FtsB
MLRWVALILILILIGLQMKLWTGNGSMHDVENLRAAVRAQGEKNAKQIQLNQALAADVADLKNGKQAIEARARSELGLIKPGEVFYQVVEKPANAGTAPAPASTVAGGR